MKWRTWRLCFCYALMSGVMTHAYAGEGIKEGMTISSARSVLLKKGWIPNPSKRSRAEPMWSLEKQLYHRGYGEIDRCAMDRPVCILKYKRSQVCLEVEVEGVKASNMRVIGWSHACEPDN